jgi:hypothetical protein
MLPFATGLIAGTFHVFSGPDHLAAIAPIATDSPNDGLKIGFTWGLGHALGISILGGIALLFQGQFNIGKLSTWSEIVVGLLLIGIGCWSIKKASLMTIHSHDHDHADHDHKHLHIHLSQTHSKESHISHSHSAFGIGWLHGMAGSGHLFGVIPALAMTQGNAVIYLVAYLCSAIGSMTFFASLLCRWLQHGTEMRLQRMLYGSGGSAVAIGVAWLGFSA